VSCAKTDQDAVLDAELDAFREYVLNGV